MTPTRSSRVAVAASRSGRPAAAHREQRSAHSGAAAPGTHIIRRALLLCAGGTLALTAVTFAINPAAFADPNIETQLPADGVQSIERLSEREWRLTFAGVPTEVKVMNVGATPPEQCGVNASVNHGVPLCATTITVTLPKAKDCPYWQVDGIPGFKSSDPFVGRTYAPPTSTPSPSPTPSSTPSTTPTPMPEPTTTSTSLASTPEPTPVPSPKAPTRSFSTSSRTNASRPNPCSPRTESSSGTRRQNPAEDASSPSESWRGRDDSLSLQPLHFGSEPRQSHLAVQPINQSLRDHLAHRPRHDSCLIHQVLAFRVGKTVREIRGPIHEVRYPLRLRLCPHENPLLSAHQGGRRPSAGIVRRVQSFKGGVRRLRRNRRRSRYLRDQRPHAIRASVLPPLVACPTRLDPESDQRHRHRDRRDTH